MRVDEIQYARLEEQEKESFRQKASGSLPRSGEYVDIHFDNE